MNDKSANSILGNFWDTISDRVNLVTISKQKRSLIVLVVLIIGLISGINLVQRVQELREKALVGGARADLRMVPRQSRAKCVFAGRVVTDQFEPGVDDIATQRLARRQGPFSRRHEQ